MAQRFSYSVEFDWLNSTSLKKTFKTAQKRNVKPGMATYWYNSMLCKFSDPNYEWHNDLATRSNSTSRIQPALKRPLKWHKKEMLSLVWLHIGTIVCCASFRTQIMSGTTIYLPGQIRPASKRPLKRHKKLKLRLIWLHTGTMVCCTSFNQNFTLATTIYLPGRIRPASKTALKWHKKTTITC